MSDTVNETTGEVSEGTKRRMPDYLRRFLLRVQGGRLYLPAAQRLVWFRDECPDWGITTELIEGGQEAGFATVRATVCNPEGRVIASGLKTETRQDFPAGWVEKAETGSIARALSVCGFGTQFSPDLDDANALADSPQGNGNQSYAGAQPSNSAAQSGPTGGATAATAAKKEWKGEGQCPSCHCPSGRKHSNTCKLPLEQAEYGPVPPPSAGAPAKPAPAATSDKDAGSRFKAAISQVAAQHGLGMPSTKDACIYFTRRTLGIKMADEGGPTSLTAAQVNEAADTLAKYSKNQVERLLVNWRDYCKSKATHAAATATASPFDGIPEAR